MVRITFWLQLLLLVLMLRHSDAVSGQCSELQNEISRLEGHILKRITDLEYRNEILEQLKTEIHVSETAFRSLKLEEYEFKSKLLQSARIISSFKKELQENDGDQQSNNKKQAQLQTTINNLTDTMESLNQTVQAVCEKQKQLQSTIDGQTKKLEALNETVKLLCRQTKDVCRNLVEAAKSGDVNTVKGLVRCINDSCTADEFSCFTPLICAARNGHVEVVRVLLEGGADAERANAYQLTALHEAAWYGYLEVCRLLLDLGAKVNPLDKWKETPLHDAARSGNLSVVKLLVERGADVGVMNISGHTAGDVARSKGKIDVADWLDTLSV